MVKRVSATAQIGLYGVPLTVVPFACFRVAAAVWFELDGLPMDFVAKHPSRDGQLELTCPLRSTKVAVRSR
jgi:hypothetical protein